VIKDEVFLPTFLKIWEFLEEQLVEVERVHPGGATVMTLESTIRG
jgi:hypothetical protein